MLNQKNVTSDFRNKVKIVELFKKMQNKNLSEKDQKLQSLEFNCATQNILGWLDLKYLKLNIKHPVI